MEMGQIADLATSIGFLVAAVALVLNLKQFKRLEMSIKGGTYQQLVQSATEIKRLLIENESLNYLYTIDSGDKRKQLVFDSLIGNYLENVWIQKKYGLIDEEMWSAFDGLIKIINEKQPHIIEQMKAENYVSSLRVHIENVIDKKEDA